MLIRDEKWKIKGSNLSEFEELLEKIQEQKPELTKQDIDDKIKCSSSLMLDQNNVCYIDCWHRCGTVSVNQ